MRASLELIASFAVLSSVAAAEVAACSVDHVDTAAEITDRAAVIMLVRVPDRKVAKIAPIKMTVLEVLKGDFKGQTVVIRGQTAKYHGPNDNRPPYDWVRAGGRFGNCFAEDYKPGGRFLLFLRHGQVHWSPLAATNEEVSGANDPWVRWVKKRLGNRPKV
jgi:hypothetical protein